ncbi:member of Set1p complex, histone methyl transferase [Haplosporangium sp. Z 767]|nr:member of Set1p complex, histone methyl transferase [Haplosporangium sp. Z 767]KAF9187189.1 member of Set1p complex, histone methyl transferase [Haplosporangium sp. Z 11]
MDYTSAASQSQPQGQQQQQQPQPSPIVLTPALIGSLKVSKVFKDNTQIITSIDFDDSGSKCITSAQDESLHVYDCATGKVTALEMSPLDDQFLAGSEEAIRLWDLRSPNCQGAVSIVGRPAVAFDPSGLVFAVALGSTLRLYDVKSYDQGPFDSGTIGGSLDVNVSTIVATQLEFSSDGKNILVTTAADAHYIVDAYSPSQTRFRLVGHYSYGNETFPSGGEACWTPDGKCVVSGSRDGAIYVWDVSKAMADQAAGLFSSASGSNGGSGSVNGVPGSASLLSANGELRPFKVLKAHGTPTHVVAFNPKYLMMVSGSTELAFWEPDPNAIGVDALHDFSKGGRQ